MADPPHAFDLLALPGPLVDDIVRMLAQEDRLRLAAACTFLHDASSTWFPEPISARINVAATSTAAAESLAAWLGRHPEARLHLAVYVPDRLAVARARPAPIGSAPVLRLLGANPACLLSLDARKAGISMPPTAEQVAPFTGLQRLDTARGDVEPLWGLTKLTSLRLHNSTQGSWVGLSRLTALRSLELSFPGNIGDAIEGLAALRSLTRFQLSMEPFDAEIVEAQDWEWQNLGALPQLQELVLEGLDPAAEAIAAQLPRLAPTVTRLQLSSFSCNAFLPRLGDCSGLASLQLDAYGQEFQEGLGLLERLAPSLRRLELVCMVFDEPAGALAPLSALTGLSSLVLDEITCGAGDWEWLQPLSRLQQLQLGRCEELTEVPSLPALPALTALDLRSNRITSWSRLPALAGMLRSLCLADCGLQAVPAEVSTLVALTRLDLEQNEVASGWEHLRCLPALAELSPRSALAHLQGGGAA